jgi:diguanylate cyclase (GGDEF)-like protein/PAS domain S-box-containing protein
VVESRPPFAGYSGHFWLGGGATEDRVSETIPPLRVLVVDDDPDDRFLILDLFARLGSDQPYQVDTVSSFDEAVKVLATHRHEVVLTDFQLGAYTGADLLRTTASDAQRPPMIVLTGHGSPEIDRLCLAEGAADYLVKERLDAIGLERSLRYAVERHRLGRQLAEREREYRMLFDASPVPMWVHDPETLNILEVNIAAIEQYGYTRSEFLNLRLTDLRASEDLESFLEFNRRNRQISGHFHSGVWRHRRKDGAPIDVEIVRSDVHLDSGSVRMVLALDISAKLRAETALRASEATLRQVLRDIADGLIVLGADGRMLFVNPAACQILGEPETELVGRLALPALINPERERVEIRDAFGAVRTVDVRVSETQWNGQNAQELILHDVTEQRANERQLVMLRRAVESASDGITVVDVGRPDQPIIYVNPAYERITGYRASEVVGRNCRFLQGEDREQLAIGDVRRGMAEQRSCVAVLRNYRKDGSMFWNRLTLSPVRNHEGEVTHWIGVQTDITEQKYLEAERSYLATHDAVTGLPRYAAGSEARLEVLLKHAREHSARLILLFVDLDGFNSVNDTMGFATGDAALRQVADRLREAAGVGAEVMRYAGDEFLVAIEDADVNADLLRLATSYCERIAEPMPISSTATLYLTASVGASAFPDCGHTVLELIRQADIATNRAKRGGRNGAFVFGNELRETLGDRMALGGRMRDALTRGEFLLHYQPQVDAQDGTVVGLEALVRWDSPEFGLLPPRRFIPVAEDSGMILQLGAWVLRTACRQMRQWMDAGLTGFIVSVNVSAAQMQRPTFVEDVRKIIEETGIVAGMLELELTESVLMDNAERAVGLMHELKKLGVRLALDDFGVGYSSLSYLRRFPLDKLKIDQSFICDITQDGNDAALVRAIIAMGHHLGMRVVAEGVETIAQYGYLKRNHCDEFQGFYFSRPLSASDIPELLRRRYLMPLGPGEDIADRTLLVLDDEENIRRSLLRLLRRDGYRILDAGNAAEAFELLATHRVQVILSDQRMPGISGTEFLSQVKEMYPDTVRMVLSGFTDLSSVTEAINRGAIYKFLTKPWDDDALRAQVLEAFRRQEQLRGGT